MPNEILAGLDGLGHWIVLSARAYRSADLFAGAILLGVVGYLTALAMALVERKLLVWRSSGHIAAARVLAIWASRDALVDGKRLRHALAQVQALRSELEAGV